MLELTIPECEQYDEANNLFYYTAGRTLRLEHSLLSVAAWEAKWHKPFLSAKDDKTAEETIDYIRCMTLDNDVNPLVFSCLTPAHLEQVRSYIDEPMTATTFAKENSPPGREVITAEIIYYWMTALSIPFSCESWHLNRLLTLIKVCSIKSSPGKKMRPQELISRNRSLNRSRRKAMHSKG